MGTSDVAKDGMNRGRGDFYKGGIATEGADMGTENMLYRDMCL